MRDSTAENQRQLWMASKYGSEMDVISSVTSSSQQAAHSHRISTQPVNDRSENLVSGAEPSPQKLQPQCHLSAYPFGLSSQRVYREQDAPQDVASDVSNSVQHQLQMWDLPEQVKSQLGLKEGLPVVMKQALDSSQATPSLEAFYTTGSCQLKDLPNPSKRRSHKTLQARKLSSRDKHGPGGCHNYLIQLKRKYKMVMEGSESEGIFEKRGGRMAQREIDSRLCSGSASQSYGSAGSHEYRHIPSSQQNVLRDPSRERKEQTCMDDCTEAEDTYTGRSQQYCRLSGRRAPGEDAGDGHEMSSRDSLLEMMGPESDTNRCQQLTIGTDHHGAAAHNLYDVHQYDVYDKLLRKCHRSKDTSATYANPAHSVKAKVPKLTTWSEYQCMMDSKNPLWHHLYTSPLEAREAPLMIDQDYWVEDERAQRASACLPDKCGRKRAHDMVECQDEPYASRSAWRKGTGSTPVYHKSLVPYGDDDDAEEENLHMMDEPVPNVPSYFHDNLPICHRVNRMVDERHHVPISDLRATQQLLFPHRRLHKRKRSPEETTVPQMYSAPNHTPPSTPLLFSQSPKSEE